MWDNPHVSSQLAAAPAFSATRRHRSARHRLIISTTGENNIRRPFERKLLPFSLFLPQPRLLSWRRVHRSCAPQKVIKATAGNPTTNGLEEPSIAARPRQMPSFSAEWHLDRSVLRRRQLRPDDAATRSGLSQTQTDGRTNGPRKNEIRSFVLETTFRVGMNRC